MIRYRQLPSACLLGVLRADLLGKALLKTVAQMKTSFYEKRFIRWKVKIINYLLSHPINERNVNNREININWISRIQMQVENTWHESRPPFLSPAQTTASLIRSIYELWQSFLDQTGTETSIKTSESGPPNILHNKKYGKEAHLKGNSNLKQNLHLTVTPIQ